MKYKQLINEIVINDKFEKPTYQIILSISNY